MTGIKVLDTLLAIASIVTAFCKAGQFLMDYFVTKKEVQPLYVPAVQSHRAKHR